MNKEKNIHSGHRKRLKDKVKKFSLEALSEHEIIELLLTYSIPRKDTNKIAHNLLNKFGTIAKVINADYQNLLTVDGVGEESALFFKVLRDLIDVYSKSKSIERNWVLKNTANAVDYFRSNFEVKGNERFYILNLSKIGRVISVEEIEGYDDSEVNITTNQIAKIISTKDTKNIVVFHTHPGGSVNPSKADLEATGTIMGVCSALKIKFLDHIIYNEFEYFSFRENLDLDKKFEEFVKLFRELEGKN